MTHSYYSTKYLQRWQVPHHEFTELSEAIYASHTCRMIATYMKENLAKLTDYQLALTMLHLYNSKLPLDDYFYNEIVPITKEFVNNFDRECSSSLADIIKFCGWMKVQDDTLWQLFEKKLVAERLHRYFDVTQMVEVINGFSDAGKGSPELFAIAEAYIVKHRLALDTELRSLAEEAFKNS